MKFRFLGSTGLSVSVLGFGALEIGRDWAADVNADPQHLTFGEASKVLNAVLDRGINFIDTAPAYWYSEEFMGRALHHRRKEYVLATKVGEHCDRDGSFYDYSAGATTDFIDRSLTKLQTDYIDLLQIHSASIETLERGETWQAMDNAKRAGKIGHIGMTGNVDAAIRAVELGGFETVQVPFNLLDVSAADVLFPKCIEANIGVIIMRGLAGGKLSDKYHNLEDIELRNRIAAIDVGASSQYPDCDSALTRTALRFLMAQDAVTTAIVGTRRIEAVDKNLMHLASPMADEEKHKLHKFLIKFSMSFDVDSKHAGLAPSKRH